MGVVIVQVVAHRTTDREVPELDSSWELGFFLLFSFLALYQWCILFQVHRGGATLLVFNFPRKKMEA